MRLVPLKMSGGGGRLVHVNPEHVVCLIEAGDGRTQVVTTGLQGVSAMSLTVDETPQSVSEKLAGAQ